MVKKYELIEKNVEKTENGKKVHLASTLRNEKISFRKLCDRLSIPSKEEKEIVLSYISMYSGICPETDEKPSISEIVIEYKDLFETKYVDHIKTEGTAVKVIDDNKEV